MTLNNLMRKALPLGLLATCYMLHGPFALAASVSAMPAVIDEKGLPRDILEYSITIRNTGGTQVNLFPTVNNLTADGKQVFLPPGTEDKAVSLANWISISRGAMMLAPGESKSLPMEIKINSGARSGTYHAVVAFLPGNTRDEAEKRAGEGAQTLVNLEVISNIKEALQLNRFAPEHRFYTAPPVKFHYIIENIGNTPSVPGGTIRIYDRAGHEVKAIRVNPDAVAIAPGVRNDFAVQWEEAQNFGQYKAMLDIEYGASGKLTDTVFFWVLPWQKIAIAFGLLLVFVVVFSLILHRKYQRWHTARMEHIKRLVQVKHVVDLRHPESMKYNANEDKNNRE